MAPGESRLQPSGEHSHEQQTICIKRLFGPVIKVRKKIGVMTTFICGLQHSVIFHIKDLSVDGEKCDPKSKLNMYVEEGMILTCDAQELPKDHLSKMAFVALRIWKDQMPTNGNLQFVSQEEMGQTDSVKESRDVTSSTNEFIDNALTSNISPHPQDCVNVTQNISKKVGRVKKYISTTTGILEFSLGRKQMEAVFLKSVLQISTRNRNKSLENYLTIGKNVLFNARVESCSCQKDICIIVTSVWVDKKTKRKRNIPIPVEYGTSSTLKSGPVYNATIVKILSAYTFVVLVDDFDIPVLVFNYFFRPTPYAKPLTHGHTVTPYIAIGDTVCLTVQRNASESTYDYDWVATEAWLEYEDSPCEGEITTTNQVNYEDEAEDEFGTVMQGDMQFVDESWGLLTYTELDSPVIFERDILHLFGVPVTGLSLTQLKLEGETVHFTSENIADEFMTASQVWLGNWKAAKSPHDIARQGIAIFNYCLSKNIDSQISVILTERLSEQRLQIEDDSAKKNRSPETIHVTTQSPKKEASYFKSALSIGTCMPETCYGDKLEKQVVNKDSAGLEYWYTSSSNEDSESTSKVISETETHTNISECDNSKKFLDVKFQHFTENVITIDPDILETIESTEAVHLTKKEAKDISQKVKEVLQSGLLSILNKCHIDTSSSEQMKKYIYAIMKEEIGNIINGSFLEETLGINDVEISTPQSGHGRDDRSNICSRCRRNNGAAGLHTQETVDSGSQTASTGTVFYLNLTNAF